MLPLYFSGLLSYLVGMTRRTSRCFTCKRDNSHFLPYLKSLSIMLSGVFLVVFSTATRVMIFSQYRDSVKEITDMLNVHNPMVKVMSFIGQSSAGKATKGFTQKEQLKVCNKLTFLCVVHVVEVSQFVHVSFSCLLC